MIINHTMSNKLLLNAHCLRTEVMRNSTFNSHAWNSYWTDEIQQRNPVDVIIIIIESINFDKVPHDQTKSMYVAIWSHR